MMFSSPISVTKHQNYIEQDRKEIGVFLDNSILASVGGIFYLNVPDINVYDISDITTTVLHRNGMGTMEDIEDLMNVVVRKKLRNYPERTSIGQ